MSSPSMYHAYLPMATSLSPTMMDPPSPERNFLLPSKSSNNGLINPSPSTTTNTHALSRSSSFNSQHSRSSSFNSTTQSRPTNLQQKRIDPLEAAAITAASSPTVLPWPSCYLPSYHASISPASSATTPTPFNNQNASSPVPQQHIQQSYFAPMPISMQQLNVRQQQNNNMQRAIPPSQQYTSISPPQEFCLPPSAFERHP